jgi:hypothetical protein
LVIGTNSPAFGEADARPSRRHRIGVFDRISAFEFLTCPVGLENGRRAGAARYSRSKTHSEGHSHPFRRGPGITTQEIEIQFIS